jgi:phage terminase small subunit
MSETPQLKNPQHQKFAEAYLRHFNRTQAAIDAEYSEASAGNQGYRLMKNDEIRAYVRARMAEEVMDTTEVLYHLAEIARGNIRDVTDANGNLDLGRAELLGKTGIIRKVKNRAIVTENSDINETEVEVYDKTRALELIGKHLAMFTDKLQVVDWRSQAIDDIRAGKYTHDEIAALFGDRDLATELFAQAGKSVTVGRE